MVLQQSKVEVRGKGSGEDPRIKLLDRSIQKSGGRPDSLIQVLHVAQSSYGYLPREVIKHITKSMHLPPSRVFGVVTFYHFFSLKPKGEHTCLICTGTACYVKGAIKILQRIEDHFKVKPGEVTSDNKIGIQTARCLGACGLAPAMVVDDEVVPKVHADDAIGMIEERIKEEK